MKTEKPYKITAIDTKQGLRCKEIEKGRYSIEFYPPYPKIIEATLKIEGTIGTCEDEYGEA
jgi:hypothetical protein